MCVPETSLFINDILITVYLYDRYIAPGGTTIDSGDDSHARARETRFVIRHDPRKYLTRELRASFS